MEGYFIRPTRVTPSVYFNPKKGIMDLRGKSCPENPLLFYRYLFKSLDQFATQPHDFLKTNMAFEYFNTSSSKCLFHYLKKLDELEKQGKKVMVNWFYEDADDDMYETGEDLSSFFSMPFNFIGVEKIKILGGSKPNRRLVA